MSEYKIECISLSKQYSRNNQKVTGVENINLRVRENELVLLKGRSGAGKSTLINLMCGLIEPTQGKAMIDGHCIHEMPDDLLSDLLLNQVGIIFQDFNLLPTYTIFENIEIAIVPKKLEKKLARDTIMSVLEQFQLINKSKALPAELSIGQQQKVAIIRTLVKQPSILFADEPTGSLDEETAAEILEHLLQLKNEKHLTLIIATHGNILEKLADQTITIENGHVKNEV
jgi:putative ABC transport system ATP-binding protein